MKSASVCEQTAYVPRVRIWLCILLLTACQNREHATVESQGCGSEPVLFVAATGEELAPVLAHATATRNMEWMTCGELSGHAVLFDVVGVGPARSTRNTEAVLSRFNVSAVVMVGIAGGISRDLRIGDVSVPVRWSRHDAAEVWFDADPELVRRARERSPALQPCDDPSVCAATPKLVIGGNGVTGARFIADPATAAAIESRLGAAVTDMETAAVAEVAHRHAVPFIAFRAVSDLVWTGRSRELIDDFGGTAELNAAAAAVAAW
jgi:adenosylhomocysteine nucleosidase